MTIPTNTEILTRLDRLDIETADELETQWLDDHAFTSTRTEREWCDD